ncbi:MAG: hypothetical protein MUF18_16125 [Fimbriiglobus sp.]|nr:hypothetical protein [Fimbriiglobus sp.]
MRSNRYIWALVLSALVGGTPAFAQGTSGLLGGSSVGPNGGFANYSGSGGGGEGLIDGGGVPGSDGRLSYFTAPLGNPAKQGPFAFMDATVYTQTWTLGRQVVAVRGLRDTTGVLTGTPGTLIGSGTTALFTGDLGRTEYAPGVNIGLGWKFDDGSSVHARIMHIAGQTWGASASLAAPYARSGPNLADTFLVSDVFNFPPQFGGPLRKTAFEGTFVGRVIDAAGNVIEPGEIVPDGAFYGIWNGASNMSIEFKRWYTEAEIGGRTPLFESNSSKVYGIGGVRYHMFMERFRWLAQSFDLAGNTGGRFEATYDNILSQRMYGPYIGCSHDLYLKNNFSVSVDLTGEMLINFVRERAYYKLGDETVQAKRARNAIDLVPAAGGSVNLWWYPVRGVQMRVGYTANTFFNTRNMDEPIGFNYGAIDPAYGRQAFRLIHGLNIGFGVFF